MRASTPGFRKQAKGVVRGLGHGRTMIVQNTSEAASYPKTVDPMIQHKRAHLRRIGLR